MLASSLIRLVRSGEMDSELSTKYSNSDSSESRWSWVSRAAGQLDHEAGQGHPGLLFVGGQPLGLARDRVARSVRSLHGDSVRRLAAPGSRV